MGISIAFYAHIAEKTASKQVKRFSSGLHAYNAAEARTKTGREQWSWLAAHLMSGLLGFTADTEAARGTSQRELICQMSVSEDNRTTCRAECTKTQPLSLSFHLPNSHKRIILDS